MTVSSNKAGKKITLGTLDRFGSLFSQLFGNTLDISGYTVRLKNPNNEVLSSTGDLQAALIPTGTIFPWCSTSSTPPAGFLLCDGSAVSRTTYANLFNTIGIAYGQGDGSSTFNVPNSVSYPGLFHASSISNSNNDGYLTEQLPNITGSINSLEADTHDNPTTTSGVFSLSSTSAQRHRGSLAGVTDSIVQFNAHNSSSVYTDNGVVRPASIKVKFIIKY